MYPFNDMKREVVEMNRQERNDWKGQKEGQREKKVEIWVLGNE